MSLRDDFQRNYPFMSCIKVGGTEYIGIIINFNDSVVSMYDYEPINDTTTAPAFLLAGETWWWESNRKIPINIFLRDDMLPYRQFIKTFGVKDVELVFGPRVNLSEIAEKRTKRKSIQLVRSPRKNS